MVYDIGAHTGQYAAAIADARSVRKVIAFEPIPESYHQLVARTRDSEKIEAVHVALGIEPGQSKFFRNEFAASSSLLPMHARLIEQFPHATRADQITVEVETLDRVVKDLSLDMPDIIKLDVQGYEDRVIAGGQATFGVARWCLVELSLVELYEDTATLTPCTDSFRALDLSFAR